MKVLKNEDIIKQKIQKWIVLVSIFLLCGKFLAFHLTNSVGILTDAMESIVNVAAGIISFYSLRLAAKPKDNLHPFGHGKIELISASIEGILIAVAGGLIIYEGIRRLTDPSQIEKLDIGIVVVAVAGVINYIAGAYSIRKGKKHNSIALIAGGKHLQSDAYSTIGLVIGLILLYITKIEWIDSVLALIFGSIIIISGLSILKKTVNNLIDTADDDLLKEVIKTISKERRPAWIDIHNTKIIKYGSHIFIDCDLTLPWFYNINQGHDECKKLQDSFTNQFSERVQVSIHSDPCDEVFCKNCELMDCSYRKEPFFELNEFTLNEITKQEDE